VVKKQSVRNKQGRAEDDVPPDMQQKVLAMLLEDQRRTYSRYEELLNDEIARELARINLPLSLYTEWYWKIDLHNLFHFLHLRMDHHAQYEIRLYAETMGRIVNTVAPMSWEAFEDYIFYSERFSREELRAITDHLDVSNITKSSLEQYNLKGLEADEFLEKLKKLSKKS